MTTDEFIGFWAFFTKRDDSEYAKRQYTDAEVNMIRRAALNADKEQAYAEMEKAIAQEGNEYRIPAARIRLALREATLDKPTQPEPRPFSEKEKRQCKLITRYLLAMNKAAYNPAKKIEITDQYVQKCEEYGMVLSKVESDALAADRKHWAAEIAARPKPVKEDE